MSAGSDAGRRRDLAARLAGLAACHLRAERLGDAQRCLEHAEALEPDDFRVRLAVAKLAILRGRTDEAIRELERARTADPFDEEAADLLGQLLREQGDALPAAECLADARMLTGEIDPERTAAYAGQVDELLAGLGLDAEHRARFLAERSERLEELAAEAESSARRLLGGPTADRTQPLRGPGPLLAGTRLFKSLTREEVSQLEKVVVRCRVPEGHAVFREGQPSEDIYVVDRGRVVIQRTTPFGVQVLATARHGSIFGEMNFIDGLTRSADAVAAEDSDLLRIPHESLRSLFDADRHLAIAFLREFWQGLAEKVREGNELMKSFFAEEQAAAAAAGGAAAAARPAAAPVGRKAGVTADAKAGVLDEKGLSAEDLRVLARIAEAVSYEIEQPIFREGDPGDSLCIVFEGRVRISKLIPGVGEEALAILDRGDFFGEMAILDRAPRSANAIAHAAGTTVLKIDKAEIDALLEQENESAFEFLFVLCRILSSRLREINDKVVQWRMMSGGF